MAGSPLIGWDLLIKTAESEINSPEDVLLCLAHLVLVNAGFRCIGLGESKTFDGNETKSEALPAGWAASAALRYVYQGRLYNLKSTKLDNGIMINLLRVDEKTTSLVQLENSYVLRTKPVGGLDEMIPRHADLASLIHKQLIEKVTTSKKSKDSSCQTDRPQTSQTQPQGRSSMPTIYPGPGSPLIVIPQPPLGPVSVGEYDLNPFRRPFPNILVPPGGGGMLFEPPRNPGFPGQPGHPGGNFGVAPGSVPPGARFDPFRPPTGDNQPRRRFPPDNDELPPPGYDDMFM